MNAAAVPFMNLTASEIMSREVVAVPQEMSLRAAARLLSTAQISGAPVVDGAGRCVGVLSSTDFVHWAEKEQHAVAAHADQKPCVSAWQVMEAEELPHDCVSSMMTKDPVMCAPTTRIADLANSMLDAHIHRVVVVDEQKRPIGIVSSMDILAAVARTGRRP